MLDLPSVASAAEQSDTIAVRKIAIVEQDQPRHARPVSPPKIGVWQLLPSGAPSLGEPMDPVEQRLPESLHAYLGQRQRRSGSFRQAAPDERAHSSASDMPLLRTRVLLFGTFRRLRESSRAHSCAADGENGS